MSDETTVHCVRNPALLLVSLDESVLRSMNDDISNACVAACSTIAGFGIVFHSPGMARSKWHTHTFIGRLPLGMIA
jgi:hypothetical protein